jgi:SulP family sulfate permease
VSVDARPTELPRPQRGRAWLPVPAWLASYRAAFIGHDLLAGVTLAAYAIPVSLAYSTLAGLPPESGLYCYLFGGIAFALLGTSRQVAFGPTSAIAILLGSTLATLAQGNPERQAQLAALTALLVAAIGLIAWLLRFGHIASFISDTVLMGFKAGAAIVIGATQLPKLLGIAAAPRDSILLLYDLAQRLGETNPYSLLIGLAALAVLLAASILLPARPVALLVVIASIVASHFFEFGKHGVAVVGALPVGLPSVSLPAYELGELRLLLPLALGCFLLAFVEDVTAARTFANADRTTLDPNRELLALGAGNLASALVHGFPAAGGMSQSAVNAKAGARSPLSLVFASATIALALVFLTHPLRELPMPILAAIVFMAVKDMIDLRSLHHLRRINKIEYAVALVSMIGVLAFGILEGLLLATIFSIVMLLRWAANPHTAELGRIPGTDRFGDLARHPHNETVPGVMVFRVEGGIFYFNVDSVKDQLLRRVEAHRGTIAMVLFDLSSSPQIDLEGVRMLGDLHERLAEQGITLHLAEAHASVRELIRAVGLEERFGGIARTKTCAGLVDDWIAANVAEGRDPSPHPGGQSPTEAQSSAR